MSVFPLGVLTPKISVRNYLGHQHWGSCPFPKTKVPDSSFQKGDALLSPGNSPRPVLRSTGRGRHTPSVWGQTLPPQCTGPPPARAGAPGPRRKGCQVPTRPLEELEGDGQKDAHSQRLSGCPAGPSAGGRRYKRGVCAGEPRLGSDRDQLCPATPHKEGPEATSSPAALWELKKPLSDTVGSALAFKAQCNQVSFS